MKVVALLSGGKDSCHNMLHCVAMGHEIVALANLQPHECAEMDSFMYQTVGHEGIEWIAQAMGLPLFRRVIRGSSKAVDAGYTVTEGDEVEDLHALLSDVLAKMPEVQGVSVGAILSTYQRVRVEHVCARLNLTPLAYLWRRSQEELLDEMIRTNLTAVLIKVAAMGLEPRRHLGKTLQQMQATLLRLNQQYEVHVCGEGGEYESYTLDSPLFLRSIAIDDSEVVMHSHDAFAPVGYLRIRAAHLQDKENTQQLLAETHQERVARARALLFPDSPELDPASSPTNHLFFPRSLPLSAFSAPALPSAPSPPSSLSSLSSLSSSAFPQVKVCASGEFVISGLVCPEPRPETLEAEAAGLMEALHATLGAHGLEARDIRLSQLFVSDLQCFGQVNAVYGRAFPNEPPARVCVQLPLAPARVQLTCHGYRAGAKAAKATKHMHVQGVSHWAPANIGPYSQAVQVGATLFLAGQIGLLPATMALVPGGNVAQEGAVALQSVRNVLAAHGSMGPQHIVSGVCFVKDAAHIPAMAALWQAFVHSPDALPPLDYMVVPQLPRGGSVEWQFVADERLEQVPATCVCFDMQGPRLQPGDVRFRGVRGTDYVHGSLLVSPAALEEGGDVLQRICALASAACARIEDKAEVLSVQVFAASPLLGAMPEDGAGVSVHPVTGLEPGVALLARILAVLPRREGEEEEEEEE